MDILLLVLVALTASRGNNGETCLCASGIDPLKYKHCVLTRGTLASISASKYSQLGIDARPVIEIGYKNTIFGVEASWYLKKICTIFGDNPPRGCTKPFAYNATESYTERNTVVHFDCPKRFAADLTVSLTPENKTHCETETSVEDYRHYGK